MNLRNLLTNIGEMAKAQKLINYSAAGTSLDQLNPINIDWYPVLFQSPTGSHLVQENYTTYEITLYYLDRLLEDYHNDIDIFSSAIENLKNIIIGIKALPGVIDIPFDYVIRNFTETERMNDSIAGAYATIKVKAVNDDLCFEE